MDLPKRPSQHVTSEQAVSLLKAVLPREWIVREQPAGDYGIDVEIELAANTVSGLIFKGQVKGHQEVKWKSDGTILQPVRPETANYWRQFMVPVVLFVVDVEGRRVYWAETQGVTQTPSGIWVSRTNELPATTTRLALYVITWIDARTAQQTIYRVPLLSKRIEERMNWVDGDAWMAVEEDEVEEVRDLYEQVMRLAHVVGLDVSGVPPWEMWLARSKKFWGDGEALSLGTHAELALYMKSVFDEASVRALRLIEREDPSPANAYAKAFIQRGERFQIRHSFENRFDRIDTAAWRKIEARLEERGALRFRVDDIRRPSDNR